MTRLVGVHEAHLALLHGLHEVVEQLDDADPLLDQGPAADRVARARRAAASALAEAARLSAARRPLPDLESALRGEVARLHQPGQRDVVLVVAGPPGKLDDALAAELLRAARRALGRATTHGAAQYVRIGLIYQDSRVTLLIQDDGVGLDATGPAALADLGLREVADRIRGWDGMAEVESIAGWGTLVRICAPRVRIRAGEPPATLTGREAEVLDLVRRGLRDKQIAHQLCISVKTVEKHVGSILRKLEAHSRTELAILDRPGRETTNGEWGNSPTTRASRAI